jgi:hypothetical protein
MHKFRSLFKSSCWILYRAVQREKIFKTEFKSCSAVFIFKAHKISEQTSLLIIVLFPHVCIHHRVLYIVCEKRVPPCSLTLWLFVIWSVHMLYEEFIDGIHYYLLKVDVDGYRKTKNKWKGQNFIKVGFSHTKYCVSSNRTVGSISPLIDSLGRHFLIFHFFQR